MTTRSVLGRLFTALRNGRSDPDPRTTPPSVRFVSAGQGRPINVACPNCRCVGPKPPVLTLSFQPLLRARQDWTVVDCPSCGCRFYPNPQPQDYGADEMLTRGRAALYLQQGAGLVQLCRPIAELRAAPGSRYLDVGCGFGFGLDFARRAKFWEGQGIDPAQIAAQGQQRLGLPIAQRLLGDEEPALQGRCDVVMTAETLEHVPDPSAFLATLKRVLTPNGVLMLTTPDADALTPHTPPGQLVALLSPGLHIVMQSESSLLALLKQTGFTHLRVQRDGATLIAHASTAPLQFEDQAAIRPMLRTYLEARSHESAADRDLFLGFAGRALLEATNDGDLAQAARLRPGLVAFCQQHFALDLDTITDLPAEAATCSLARLAEVMPLNLAAILYADAMCALLGGAARGSQERRLACAAQAARMLLRATRELAMEDAMSEDLAWVAQAESVLCRASSGAADSARLLAALPDAPGRHGAVRRSTVQERGFVTLVHGTHFALAKALAEALGAGLDTSSPDMIFCSAILDLQPGGDPARARSGFARLRSNGPWGMGSEDLFWAALRGEMQACMALGLRREATQLCRNVAQSLGEAATGMPDDLAQISRSA